MSIIIGKGLYFRSVERSKMLQGVGCYTTLGIGELETDLEVLHLIKYSFKNLANTFVELQWIEVLIRFVSYFIGILSN